MKIERGYKYAPYLAIEVIGQDGEVFPLLMRPVNGAEAEAQRIGDALEAAGFKEWAEPPCHHTFACLSCGKRVEV